jgi:hypothetical protein
LVEADEGILLFGFKKNQELPLHRKKDTLLLHKAVGITPCFMGKFSSNVSLNYVLREALNFSS